MSKQDDGNSRIDVDALLARIDIVELVGRYITLKKAGKEWAGLCPFHGERTPSFHVVQKKQAAFCQGCGWHGNALDFVKEIDNVDFLEACRRLGADERPSAPRAPRPVDSTPDRITRRPPASAGRPDMRSSRFGEPVRVWEYRDADGLLGFVARYEFTEDDGRRKKLTPQWTWGSKDGGLSWRWGMGHWLRPRPLYGLDRLAARPDAEVLICEGEKATDAAAILPHYVNVGWPGGCQAIDHVDWSPLEGRRVILWPDADPPGIEAMQRLAAILVRFGCSVRIIDPRGQADGWDCADAVADGWTVKRIVAWAKERIAPYNPPEPPEPPESTPTRLPPSGPPDAPPKRGRPALALVDGNTAKKPAPRPEFEDLPIEYSDDAVAQAFTERHAADLRYVDVWGKWMVWTDGRWQRDTTLRARDLARAICRETGIAAFHDGALTPAQQRRAGQQLSSARTTSNVELLARADRRHAATVDQWDIDPWLLNTPSGVIDLRTGATRPARHDDHMTKITRCAAGGECPAWHAFLDIATEGDRELQSFLQRVAGYSLTGVTIEQVFFFFYGTGGNGKGTYINTLQWIMGDYAQSTDMKVFTETRNEQHSTELACLQGARMLSAQEVSDGKRWDEEKIKKVTGEDTISARYIAKDPFNFLPQFKLQVSGNNKPQLRNVDDAMRRRLRLIPFTAKISAEKKDMHLPAKLRAEASGILAWAIDGCRLWQASGLAAPARVMAATDEYLASQDTFGQWIDERCTLSEYDSESCGKLYKDFVQWLDSRGQGAPTMPKFADKLLERFKRRKGSTGASMYVGISLRIPGIDRVAPIFEDD